jgi:predicted nucleic acid-binding protein
LIVAVDTNVLGYAEGIDDDARQRIARRVLRAIDVDRLVIAAQVLAELFSVIARKSGRLDTAQNSVAEWAALSIVVGTTSEVISVATELAVQHRLQIFDAVILAAAASAQADLLLSEDMKDGFAWRGVTVANPFAPRPHPMLAALLR